jgi:putative flippase GtrA
MKKISDWKIPFTGLSVQEIIKYFWKNTFVKFCLVGIINTIVGYSIIFILIYVFSLNYILSNTIGYIVGVTVSFTLNKYCNFKSQGSVNREFPAFLICFIISYCFNVISLYAMVDILGLRKIVGLIFSGLIYTITFYSLSRWIVFQKRQKITNV